MGKIACVSGHFQPVQCGHLEYFTLAKEWAGPGGKLVVIVNNDLQARLKKGYSFMPEQERVSLIKAFRMVDEVVLSIDTDRTVCATLEMLAGTPLKPDAFLNGGDVGSGNTPEDAVCIKHGIELVFGLGDKIQSSSWLIDGAIKAAARIEAEKKRQHASER